MVQRRVWAGLLGVSALLCGLVSAAEAMRGAIRFELQLLPFQLENSETAARNLPETMLGGVALFDYDRDGDLDIFFANGANVETLKKDSPKFRNRLMRNDGKGAFSDATEKSGLAGSGYDIGVAAGDYDNDGYQDLFVAGVHASSLFHNNQDGTFTDVTAKSGMKFIDPEHGPLWSVAAGWLDANNDGRLDLFVVNYLQWSYRKTALCSYEGASDYCHPRFFKGLPNQLFLNEGNGRFEDVSAAWGLRAHRGKGMGVGVADYDADGKLDLFVPNDAEYNHLFRNVGGRFDEVAFPTNTALAEEGSFISGMGLDFRDFSNDGLPDIAYVALNNQTFPLLLNAGGTEFKEITTASGMRALTLRMAGFGAGLYDFDNDGWKDLFVSRGHVSIIPPPSTPIEQINSVFRNPGKGGKWQALTEEAGFGAGQPGRHRGCAFGDVDGDGKVDVITTAIGKRAELWLNRSEGVSHWLALELEGTRSNRDGIGARVKVTSKSGVQFNHMTTSAGYASSSAGPVHFGLGGDTKAEAIEVEWPSGARQKLQNVAADRVVKLKEPTK